MAHDAADDRDRLTRWVAEHGDAVMGYLSAFLRNRAAAEDLFQEVFCKAWETRGRYSEKGKVRGYLLTIADRLARTRVRASRRELVVEDAAWQDLALVDPQESASRSLERKELERMLDEALQTLTDAQRRALLLRYYGDMSYAQIAEAMDCPLNTALSHCHRGLAALRKLWVENSQ